MQAVIHERPQKYRYIRTHPNPVVKEGDVLLKVLANGFCGTDYKILTFGHRAVKPPRIIGHEIVGQIETIGKNAKTNLKVGDRVVVVTPVGCMRCVYCRQGRTNMCSLVSKEVHSIGYYTDGGFAEYCLIPQEAVDQQVLIKIPSKISNQQAAIVEPLSCVVNGQEKLNIKPEDVVVVIGCGPIGCLHALSVLSQGVERIIMLDISNEKIKMAKKVVKKAIFVNNEEVDGVEKVLELTDQSGADVVIVAAPSTRAQEISVKMTAVLGRISFFAGLPKGINGTQVETNLIHYRELEVYGAFASNRSQYVKALNLIAAGQVDVNNLITHIVKLKDISKAMSLFEKGKALKIIVEP